LVEKTGIEPVSDESPFQVLNAVETIPSPLNAGYWLRRQHYALTGYKLLTRRALSGKPCRKIYQFSAGLNVPGVLTITTYGGNHMLWCYGSYPFGTPAVAYH